MLLLVEIFAHDLNEILRDLPEKSCKGQGYYIWTIITLQVQE